MGLLFLACSLASCSSSIDPMPEESAKPGWHEGTLRHDGLERVFLFYIPENLPDNAPVVVLLHGGTQSMDKLFRKNAGATKEWPSVAEDKGFLLLVPNGTNINTGSPTGNKQQWNDCRPIGSNASDVGFVNELLNWADKKFSINTNRLYATGLSNGGLMAYRLARELDDRIAAIAAFIANKAQNEECQSSAHSMPVMIANGTDDPLMPYKGGEVSNGGRGTVRSTKATVQYWTQQLGIAPEPAVTDTLQNRSQDDNSRVVQLKYGSADAGAPVVLYKVVSGGHLMPSVEHEVPRFVERLLGSQNNDVEGARLAWDFFAQYSLH
ncbi:MAG TPA: PHB depolymerase family esterase [Fodinibius sp.]|nr:PHB depolymerase family esterase [Fodinibius sp.]